MFQFPFGTMHQLNLDWFLQQWQQLRQDWVDEQQHIDDSMQDVYDARDAAIQAKDDAVAAKNDAQTAKNAADADALMAEGFAVGEQNGTPVGPGDPYYQSNAKFYSIESGTYRYLSEAYARGTMGGTPVDPGDAGYEDNAKYYKDAAAASAQDASDDADYVRDHVTDADASALESEGWAVGEQGGTPVASGSPYYENNAKYYAGEAQQDKLDTDTLKDAANAAALRAEGYSSGTQNGTPVSSGSPYYENNAKYYSDIASQNMFMPFPFFDYLPDNFENTSNNRKITVKKNRIKLEKLGNSTTVVWWSLFGAKLLGTGSTLPESLIDSTDFVSYDPAVGTASTNKNLSLKRWASNNGHGSASNVILIMTKASDDTITITEALNDRFGNIRIADIVSLVPEINTNHNFGIVIKSVNAGAQNNMALWLE